MTKDCLQWHAAGAKALKKSLRPDRDEKTA
jgi:hypothetical protein